MRCIDLRAHGAAISQHFDDVIAVHVDRASNWFGNFLRMVNELLRNDSTAFNRYAEIIFCYKCEFGLQITANTHSRSAEAKRRYIFVPFRDSARILGILSVYSN